MEFTQGALEKKELRQLVCQRVAGLTEEYLRESGRAICAAVTALPDYQAARAVFCFVGAGREVDTAPILADALRRGKRLGVPLCTGKGIMEIREIDRLDRLIPGKYGILEPEATCPLMRPEEIEFALIPCVACDRAGRRLGHGGGYYDRYLENATFPMATVCREQLLCEAVPVEAHDIPIPVVITELGARRV